MPAQVGSVNADLVLPIERLPQPGETLGATSMETIPGGKVRRHIHVLPPPKEYPNLDVGRASLVFATRRALTRQLQQPSWGS